MTEPHQRTRALLKTRYFLEQLTRPGDTPGVADDMHATAQQLLKHYPTDDDIDTVHEASPEIFGPVVQRQPLGETAEGGRSLPIFPMPPGGRGSEMTPAEQVEYSKKVAAWKKRTGY